MCRQSFKGVGVNVQSPAAPYLAEYNARMRLAKLGYTDDLSNLDSETAEAFLLISQTFSKLESDEMKKKSQRKGR